MRSLRGSAIALLGGLLALAAGAQTSAGGPPSAASSGAPNQTTAPERLTFRQVIERTLARNPSIQQAAAEVLRAEALITETRASSLPDLRLNAQYQHNGHVIKLGSTFILPPNLKTANATLTVPVVSLARWADWAHAIDNQKIAELSLADVKRREAVAAANAFLAVIARRRVLETNQLALTTARSHFDIAHQRQVGGISSRLEEVQASQESANDEVLAEQAALQVSRAQEALAVLLAAEGPVEAADEPTFEELGSIADVATGIEARRADVQVQAMRESAAAHVLRDSWRDYFPIVQFVFQELYQDPSNLFSPAHNWLAQLQLTLPLYDGGLRIGLRRERQALVQEAHAGLIGQEVQARSEVRTAIEAIRSADRALASARHAAALAHEALDISNLSYSAGAATNLDVLDSLRKARDADTAAAVAEDAARQARLDLLVAGGRFP